ncbi:MAG: peptidase M23 [Lachnospiraceae bacterium]|nr:peptidase M23 [Lachnospiraceae bacterium]
MNRQKKGRKRRLAAIGMTAVIAVSGVMVKTADSNFVQASSYEQKLLEAQNKKAELEKKKQETEKKIAALEKEKRNIASYIEKLDQQLNEITLSLEKINSDIAATNEELVQTQAALEEAREMEEKQYETMKNRIQYMYENGSTSVFEIFLSSEGIADFLNQMEYQKKITDYDNNLLKRYQETKELIASQEALLAAKLEELKVLKESAEFEQASLEQLVADKNAEIERYTSEIGISDELLFEYMDEITSQEMTIEQIKEEEERRIAEAIKKAEEEKKRLEEEKKKQEAANNQNTNSGSNSNSSGSSTGSSGVYASGMIWPLPGDYRVFSGFGYRVAPTAGASTFHKGVDIGGEMGAKIVAVMDGTVAISSYSTTGGNYIRISHGNGLQTSYLHCSKLFVSAGQTVKQGDVIALVGSTGVSTGPHLHFSVSINGTYVDPKGYINY